MTWTKLGSEFFPECLHTGLTDAAVRTHCEAIAYLYEVEEMRCLVPKRLVRTFTGSDRSTEAIKELCELGWWVEQDLAYEVRHHGDVIRQSIAAQGLKRQRDKKAQQRRRDKDSDGGSSTAGTPNVSADISAYTDRQTDKHLEETTSGRQVCKHWVDVSESCDRCMAERKSA